MNFPLDSSPLVVATVTQASDLSFFFTGGETVADVLEYRVDTLYADIRDAYVAVVDSVTPTMITARRHEEGGSLELPDEERLALYEKFMPHAAAVDTEIASLESAAFRDFPASVSAADAQLIASFHDFERFPGISVLKDKATAAFDLGADVAKLAVIIEEMKDLFALVELVEHHRSEGRRISAMGMGPLGKLSRLVLARAGSCLNYGYLNVPNAPGQWSAVELKDLVSAI